MAFSLPPQHAGRFIGREPETLAVKQLLTSSRLVTLTGVGGCGKTQLAIHVVAHVSSSFPDGVCWVELASLSDAHLLLQTVADALDIRESTAESLNHVIIQYLQAKHLLLVLDTCEHLLSACAPFVEGVLAACSALHVLATSRQRLGVVGEVAWLVPSLTLPPVESTTAPAPLHEIAGAESVQLFVERAASVVPGFTLTPDNAAGVVQICRRLDGLPLAIELAAARVNVLTAEQIAARLDDAFVLLAASNRRALIPRHQTLRATMDWSHALLSPEEQRLFRRLAVFAGGFTLDAVEAVCGDERPMPTLDLLSGLVEKSLVVAQTLGRPAARFRLLDTIQQYALEKLQIAGEWPRLRSRHLAWYRDVAEREDARMHFGREGRLWLARMTEEHDNFRAALTWARDHAQAEDGLRLAGVLWRFWWIRGNGAEGTGWLAELMAAPASETPAWIPATALHAGAALLYCQGMFAEALEFAEACLALRRAQGDQRGCAESLNLLAALALTRGDHDRAAQYYDEALAQARLLADQWWIGTVLNNIGELARRRGDYRRALELYEDALRIKRAMEDESSTSVLLENMGLLAIVSGEYAHAAMLLEECVALNRERDDTAGLARALVYHASARLHQGETGLAAGLLDEGMALCRAMNDRPNLAFGLAVRGDLARVAGEPGRAVAYYEQSLTLFEAFGNPEDIARASNALGRAAMVAGDAARAEAQHQHGLRLSGAAGNRPGMAESFEGLAVVASARRNHLRVARLLSAAAALREATGGVVPPSDAPLLENITQSSREALGVEGFERAWRRTQADSAEQVMAEALQSQATDLSATTPPYYPGGLTQREVEVLHLLAMGMSNQEIAERLVVSRRTVHAHLRSIYGKLDVSTRKEATRAARELNLI